MKLITLYLPEGYIRMLDQLVAERFYPNRAEAIRVAIRELLSSEGLFKISSKSPTQKDLDSAERLADDLSRRVPRRPI